VVEHILHTDGVVGSNPTARTISKAPEIASKLLKFSLISL
jgi:hypothetical protein